MTEAGPLADKKHIIPTILFPLADYSKTFSPAVTPLVYLMMMPSYGSK
jgi:hypothetical protein